jgi:hypothetical protein
MAETTKTQLPLFWVHIIQDGAEKALGLRIIKEKFAFSLFSFSGCPKPQQTHIAVGFPNALLRNV